MNKAIDSKQVHSIATQVFSEEIAGILQVQQYLDDAFVTAVDLMYNCSGKVVVAGMGKSGHIGNKIASTLASTGTPAFFVHPAEALHGDLGMIDAKDVVLAISYSGEADELLIMLPLLKRKGVPLIAITSNLDSTLAQFANCVLNIAITKEACPLGLAPTTSTTATLVLGDALAVSLLTLKQFKHDDFALSHPGGSLGRKLLTTVADIMHSGERLPHVLHDATLKDVVVEISNKGLGLTAVVDKDDYLVGVVTDGDLRRLLDKSPDILTTKACDIMNREPKVIHVDSLAATAVNLMEQNRITGFLVVDDNNKLVGAFNLHDLFRAKLL